MVMLIINLKIPWHHLLKIPLPPPSPPPPKKEFEDVSKSKFVYNKGINIPNRFNIPAGYFWDGIDRSNGFEQMYLRKQTEYNYDKIDSKINETYEIDIGDD